MEHPEDLRRGLAAVLDAVHLVGRQMEARARSELKRVPADMGESFALDDVADLVVGVAVERGLARLDDPHELCDVEAARFLVHEIEEGALAGGLELWLIPEADRDLTFTA